MFFRIRNLVNQEFMDGNWWMTGESTSRGPKNGGRRELHVCVVAKPHVTFGALGLIQVLRVENVNHTAWYRLSRETIDILRTHVFFQLFIEIQIKYTCIMHHLFGMLIFEDLLMWAINTLAIHSFDCIHMRLYLCLHISLQYMWAMLCNFYHIHIIFQNDGVYLKWISKVTQVAVASSTVLSVVFMELLMVRLQAIHRWNGPTCICIVACS